MHVIELLPNRTQPAQLPVLDTSGRQVGYARSAKEACGMTSKAMLCKVDGAVVYAAPSCKPTANWSLVPKQ